MNSGHDRAVAIIMTLYKSDDLNYFETAMASLDSQTFAGRINIYLCIDGPLPQQSELWLEKNARRFFRIVRNEMNLGLARSLNKLIDILGDEEFVFRMDGDDVSMPNRFRDQAAFMDENPEISLCGCQVMDMDADGNELGIRTFPTTAEATREALSRLMPVLHPTFCIRGSVFSDPAIRYPDAHLAEDLGFVVLLAEAGLKFTNHPDVLFKWRLGDAFFKRRKDLKRGVAEMKLYFRAVRLNGKLYSRQAVFPLLRLLLRVMPEGLVKVIYDSYLRKRVIGG